MPVAAWPHPLRKACGFPDSHTSERGYASKMKRPQGFCLPRFRMQVPDLNRDAPETEPSLTFANSDRIPAEFRTANFAFSTMPPFEILESNFCALNSKSEIRNSFSHGLAAFTGNKTRPL